MAGQVASALVGSPYTHTHTHLTRHTGIVDFFYLFLPGVPAWSELYPWQCGGSQRPGGWRSERQAVGFGPRLLQESPGGIPWRSAGHGSKEVAGT